MNNPPGEVYPCFTPSGLTAAVSCGATGMPICCGERRDTIIPQSLSRVHKNESKEKEVELQQKPVVQVEFSMVIEMEHLVMC